MKHSLSAIAFCLYLLLTATFALQANETSEVAFQVIPCPHFTLAIKQEVSDPHTKHIYSHQFTNREMRINVSKAVTLATFKLIITNRKATDTTDSVYIWGHLPTPDNEFTLYEPLGEKLILEIYTNKNSSGGKQRTELKSGSLVREIGPSENLRKQEVYHITVRAKKRTLKKRAPGVYDTMIYFSALCA